MSNVPFFLRRLVPALGLLTLPLLPQPIVADDVSESTATLRRQLYRASIAAADASLQLHRVADVRRWLDQTPSELRGWEWHYLNGKSDESAARFETHGSTATHLAISPDASLLAVSFADGSVHLRRADSGERVHDLKGHRSAVWSPAFSADGKQLATISSDGTARVWSVESGTEEFRLDGVGEGVSAIAWSPDQRRLAACYWERIKDRGVVGCVALFDVASRQRIFLAENGVKPLSSIAYSPDGNQLAVGSWDRDVTLWGADALRLEQTLLPPENKYYQAVNAVAYSPDGGKLAVAAKDGTLRIWNPRTQTLERTLIGQAEGERQSVQGVVWLSPEVLASTGADGTVRVWNGVDGSQSHLLHGATKSQLAMAWDARRARLLTAGAEPTIRVWDVPSSDSSLWHMNDVMYSVSLSPDGGQAVCAGWKGWIEIFDVATGRRLDAWQGHEVSAVGADWSPDGKWIATTGNDGRVVVWNAEKRTLHKVLLELDAVQIVAAVFSPDGNHLLSGGIDGATYVWTVPDGELVSTLRHGAGTMTYIDWSADGRLLASASSDGSVVVWSWPEGKLVHVIQNQTAAARPIRFHPRESRLLIAGPGSQLRVWNAATAEEEWTSQLSAGVVNSVAWSPAGDRVAVCLVTHAVAIHEASTGEPLLSLRFDASTWAVHWPGPLFVIPLDRTARVFTP